MPFSTYAFLGFVGIASLIALSNWRLGLFLVILAAVFQDPIRKTTPDAPAEFVLSITPIVCGVVMSLWRDQPWAFQQFSNREPLIVRGIVLLALWLLIPTGIGVVNYGFGGLQMAAIGFLFYGVGLTAIMIGYQGGIDAALTRKLCSFFCLLTALMCVGVVLEVSDKFPNWLALGTEAMDMHWVRHLPGRLIEMKSGFYRSPDVLGWHSIIASLLALTLAFSTRYPAARIFWVLLAAWMMVGVYYCGRRKFLYILPIFLLAWVWSKRHRGKDLGGLILGGAIVMGLFVIFILPRIGTDEDITYYYLSTVGESVERLNQGGFQAILGTIRQSGFFGDGLGSAATGVHRIKGLNSSGNWQESGTSRLAVELGVPGLILILLLGWRVMVRSNRIATALGSSPNPDAQLYVGLFAILLANLASFVVSHQVFGDPFVGFFSAFLLGALLGGGLQLSPRAQHQTRLQRSPQTGGGSNSPRGLPSSNSVPAVSKEDSKEGYR